MNPEENAEKNSFVAHYLNEWSMWMDTHPGGLKRTTEKNNACLLYTSPSPRDVEESRMPSSA